MSYVCHIMISVWTCIYATFYKDANKFKLRQQDENNWMIGMYVYEAILDCSPVHMPFLKRNKPLRMLIPFLWINLTKK